MDILVFSPPLSSLDEGDTSEIHLVPSEIRRGGGVFFILFASSSLGLPQHPERKLLKKAIMGGLSLLFLLFRHSMRVICWEIGGQDFYKGEEFVEYITRAL
jgi:hypothetical protein